VRQQLEAATNSRKHRLIPRVFALAWDPRLPSSVVNKLIQNLEHASAGQDPQSIADELEDLPSLLHLPSPDPFHDWANQVEVSQLNLLPLLPGLWLLDPTCKIHDRDVARVSATPRGMAIALPHASSNGRIVADHVAWADVRAGHVHHAQAADARLAHALRLARAALRNAVVRELVLLLVALHLLLGNQLAWDTSCPACESRSAPPLRRWCGQHGTARTAHGQTRPIRGRRRDRAEGTVQHIECAHLRMRPCVFRRTVVARWPSRRPFPVKA